MAAFDLLYLAGKHLRALAICFSGNQVVLMSDRWMSTQSAMMLAPTTITPRQYRCSIAQHDEPPRILANHLPKLRSRSNEFFMAVNPPSMMPMDIFLMLVTALGCASIGWAVIYFVSKSPTALNTGRRPFAASASAAAGRKPPIYWFGSRLKRSKPGC
jgi:hypothetical protein